jgi:hypothetical protein
MSVRENKEKQNNKENQKNKGNKRNRGNQENKGSWSILLFSKVICSFGA